MIAEDNEQVHAWVPSSVKSEFKKIVEEKYGGRYGAFSTELTTALQEHISAYKKEVRTQQHTHANLQDKKEQELLRIKGKVINYIMNKYGFETTHVQESYLKEAIIFAIDKKDSRTVNNWLKYFIAKGLFFEDSKKIKIQSAFSGEEIAPLQGDLR